MTEAKDVLKVDMLVVGQKHAAFLKAQAEAVKAHKFADEKDEVMDSAWNEYQESMQIGKKRGRKAATA